MEIDGNVVRIQPFVAFTTAIIVLFVGKALNRRLGGLRYLNISESVSGGLLISIILAVIYFVSRIEVYFDLAARHYLAVYFFTSIGINTSLRHLLAARRALVTLLVASVAYIVMQDIIAVLTANAFGYAGPKAVLAGTIALIGGSDAVMALAPTFVEEFGIANAKEIGIASVAFGLILGSLAGGPTARYLIQRHGLRSDAAGAPGTEPSGGRAPGTVDTIDFLQSILVINICIIVGLALNQIIDDAGYRLPLPVVCFAVAIVLTSLVPTLFPKISWPSNTSAMALISEFSLGTLFGLSLIGAQLWVIADLPAQLLTIVLVQVVATVVVTVLVIFRIMGRDHDAAVMCSGFIGFTLGSTSTAMANIKAMTERTRRLHIALIIVPLVAVLSGDIFNRFLVPLFLDRF